MYTRRAWSVVLAALVLVMAMAPGAASAEALEEVPQANDAAVSADASEYEARIGETDYENWLDRYPSVPIVELGIRPGTVYWSELIQALAAGTGDTVSLIPFDEAGNEITSSTWISHSYVTPGQHAVYMKNGRLYAFINVMMKQEGNLEMRLGSWAMIAGMNPTKCIFGATAREMRTVDSLLAQVEIPDGYFVVVKAPNGTPLHGNQLLATGCTITLYDRSLRESDSATIVVWGDALGNGRMSIAQVVRAAKAVTQDAPLYGPYLRSVTNLSRPNVADVVSVARQLL